MNAYRCCETHNPMTETVYTAPRWEREPGCVDCQRNVFHTVHITAEEHAAKIARLKAALAELSPIKPSDEETS